MHNDFPNLPLTQAAFAAAMSRPRLIALGGVVTLAALGWGYIAVAAASAGMSGTFSALGPGMDAVGRLFEWLGLGRIAFPIAASSGILAALGAICTVAPGAWTTTDAVAHFGMWSAMVLAMMLPTAAPMLRTYAEIADTAAAKGRRVVSPLVLGAGYLSVWIGFAGAATCLQWTFGISGLWTAAGVPTSAVVAAGVVAAAGLYQFLPLKAACLVKCANPFPFLFANWTEQAGGVFRLGLRQGVFCLGCCWATMLVMFAVGVMNVLWIILLTALMTAEKLVGRQAFSRVVGLALLTWSGAIVVAGFGSPAG